MSYIVEYHDVFSCQQQLVMYRGIEHVGKVGHMGVVNALIDVMTKPCSYLCRCDVMSSRVYAEWDVFVFIQCCLQKVAQEI